MSSDSSLISAFSLNDKLRLRNRVVMAPLTRARAGKERIPTDAMVEYYRQRASAGLIISEATVVSKIARGWVESPGIYNDEQMQGWKRVVDAVHAEGGLIFLQLWHMGRASHSSFHDNGELPVAPSAIKINGDGIHTPNGKEDYETPHALTIDEIKQTIQDYRNAAKRAMQAGFDGVEIHSANGYLLDQFLQSKTNQRTDEYGGSIEKRYRMLDEVVQAVTQEVPAERVGVRLAPNGVFNDMGSADYRESFTYVAQQLNQYGLAHLHVMDGLAFGFHEQGEPMTLDEFRQVFDGPLMGNCGYTQETAEQAIEDGKADLIAFGRPYLSNPDLVERFSNDWALAPEADVELWWTPREDGFVDFPAYEAV
ncbi:MAG: alkene reductase [Gammaproteobacteria bacterium]|nr:MAG: alkene reductase [Gammaproteobacteria bacterium]